MAFPAETAQFRLFSDPSNLLEDPHQLRNIVVVMQQGLQQLLPDQVPEVISTTTPVSAILVPSDSDQPDSDTSSEYENMGGPLAPYQLDGASMHCFKGSAEHLPQQPIKQHKAPKPVDSAPRVVDKEASAHPAPSDTRRHATVFALAFSIPIEEGLRVKDNEKDEVKAETEKDKKEGKLKSLKKKASGWLAKVSRKKH